jgi:transposase-like protein
MAAWRRLSPEGWAGESLRYALTLDDLPSADTRRWVARRKALVVKGVHAGLISAEDACARYDLSPEELRAWQRQFSRYGLPGLRARQRNPVPRARERLAQTSGEE